MGWLLSKGSQNCEHHTVERYYRDLDSAFDKGWYFDRKAAVRAITFIERLKHTKGEWAGQRFRLEPWQLPSWECGLKPIYGYDGMSYYMSLPY